MRTIVFRHYRPAPSWPTERTKTDTRPDLLQWKILQHTLENVPKVDGMNILRELSKDLDWTSLFEVLRRNGIEARVIETPDGHIDKVVVQTGKEESIVLDIPYCLDTWMILRTALDNSPKTTRKKILRDLMDCIGWASFVAALHNNGVDIQINHKGWRGHEHIIDVVVLIWEMANPPAVSGTEWDRYWGDYPSLESDDIEATEDC